MWPISVFIMAANDIMAFNCRKLLSKERDIKVVGQTKKAYEAIEVVKDIKPRILLLDIALIGFNHAKFVQHICHYSPNTCVVLLTHKTTPASYIIDVLIHGALGYIEDSTLPLNLSKAIRRIDAGEGWVSRKLISVILDYLLEPSCQRKEKYTH